MSSETLKYEPHLALFGEDIGLASYYIIGKETKGFLKENGKLFLEIVINQLAAVTEMFVSYGFTIKQVYKDFEGRDRGLLIT